MEPKVLNSIRKLAYFLIFLTVIIHCIQESEAVRRRPRPPIHRHRNPPPINHRSIQVSVQGPKVRGGRPPPHFRRRPPPPTRMRTRGPPPNHRRPPPHKNQPQGPPPPSKHGKVPPTYHTPGNKQTPKLSHHIPPAPTTQQPQFSSQSPQQILQQVQNAIQNFQASQQHRHQNAPPPVHNNNVIPTHDGKSRPPNFHNGNNHAHHHHHGNNHQNGGNNNNKVPNFNKPLPPGPRPPPHYGSHNPHPPQDKPVVEYAPPRNNFGANNRPGPAPTTGQKTIKQKIVFTVTPKPNPQGGSIINVQVSTPKPYKVHTNQKDYFSGSTYRPMSTTPAPLDTYYNKGTTPGYPNTEYHISDKKSDDAQTNRRVDNDQTPMASYQSHVISPPSGKPFDFPHFGKSSYEKHHRRPYTRHPIYKDGPPPVSPSVEHHYYHHSSRPSEEIYGTEFGPSKPTQSLNGRHEATFGSSLDDDEDDDDFREGYSHSSRYESDSMEHHSSMDFDDYPKKGKYGGKQRLRSEEEERGGSQYSQPDPLYHPEGDVFKSKEQVGSMSPPDRYDNSYSTNFKDEALEHIYDDHHVDSPVKQTAEELLAALGLSTNPLVTPKTDYLHQKLEPPTSWKKNVEGPYGLLDYMKQREMEKNLLNPPLQDPPVSVDEEPIYNYDKFRSSSELETVPLDGKKSGTENQQKIVVGKPLKNFGNKGLDDSEEQKKKTMDRKSFEEKIKSLGLGSKESSYLYERIHGDRKTEETMEESGSSHSEQVASHPSSYPPVDDVIGPSDAPKGSLYHQPKLESPGLYGPGHDIDESEKQNHKSYIHEKIHGGAQTQPSQFPPHFTPEQLKGIFGIPNPALRAPDKSKVLLPQGISDPSVPNGNYGSDFLGSLAAQPLHYPTNPLLAPQGEAGLLAPNPSVASPGVPLQQTHPNFAPLHPYGDPKLMWNAYLQQYGLAANAHGPPLQGQIPSPVSATASPFLNRYSQGQQGEKNEAGAKEDEESNGKESNGHLASPSIAHANVAAPSIAHPNAVPGHPYGPNPYYGQYGSPYPVYLKEPEPIIEIIVQDSNTTLPPLPQYVPPPPPPTTPEPVHVFYVKYSQKDEHGNQIKLERPISSFPIRGPHRSTNLETGESQHGPSIITESVGDNSPQANQNYAQQQPQANQNYAQQQPQANQNYAQQQPQGNQNYAQQSQGNQNYAQQSQGNQNYVPQQQQYAQESVQQEVTTPVPPILGTTTLRTVIRPNQNEYSESKLVVHFDKPPSNPVFGQQQQSNYHHQQTNDVNSNYATQQNQQAANNNYQEQSGIDYNQNQVQYQNQNQVQYTNQNQNQDQQAYQTDYQNTAAASHQIISYQPAPQQNNAPYQVVTQNVAPQPTNYQQIAQQNTQYQQTAGTQQQPQTIVSFPQMQQQFAWPQGVAEGNGAENPFNALMASFINDGNNNDNINQEVQEEQNYQPSPSFTPFNKRVGLEELATLLKEDPEDYNNEPSGETVNQNSFYTGTNNGYSGNGQQDMYGNQYDIATQGNLYQFNQAHGTGRNAQLPDDVPQELKDQLANAGILGNADVQVINFNEDMFRELGDLPPEAIAALQAQSGGNPTGDVHNNNPSLWGGDSMSFPGGADLSSLMGHTRSLRSVLVVKNSLRPKRGGRQRRYVLLVTSTDDVLLYDPKNKSIRRVGSTSSKPVISRAIELSHHNHSSQN